MALKLYQESDIQNIANSIRSKSGSQSTYTVSQMSTAIDNIPSGSSIPSYPLNNGKNNFWVFIQSSEEKIRVGCSAANITVDFGDGTTGVTTDNSGEYYVDHYYTDIGYYCIKADNCYGVKSIIGTETTSAEIKQLELNDYVDLTTQTAFDYIVGTEGNERRLLTKIKLNSLSFTDDIGSIFTYQSYLQTANLSNTSITQIGRSTSNMYGFAQCHYLTNVLLPDTLGIIGNNVFNNCNKLTSIDLKNVTTIGSYAFNDCNSLSNIDLKNITTIGGYGFSGCTSLSSVDLSSVTSIGRFGFNGCTALTGSISSTNITSIDYGAFKNTAITSVNVPNATIANNGSGAFKDCTSLTTAIVGVLNGSTSGNAFENCTALTTATINGGTNIPRSSFKNCTSLTTVNLPNTITTINGTAFSGCTSLTTLTIPASVTTISQQAFSDCTSMQEYHFLSTTPPTLENTNTFNNIPANCIIYVPASAVEDYKVATYWSDYASYIQAEPS